MVITKLQGGLGNQMFQYALGRHLAFKIKTELKLDISAFNNNASRTYSLGYFNIHERFASYKGIKAFSGKKESITASIIKRLLFIKPASTKLLQIREKNKFHFEPDILNICDNLYIDGSWQSEKYFSDISDLIRKDFTLKFPMSYRNRELSKQILSCNSVSLHIRRGDYALDPETQAFHGTCDINYYSRSIDYLLQFIENPHFFIFSDEPEWAKRHIKAPYPATFIDHNIDQGHEDIYLMSQCCHNIIANSTFSWWAAWLNSNRKKIVIAPEKWLNHSKCVTQDLLPSGWLKL